MINFLKKLFKKKKEYKTGWDVVVLLQTSQGWRFQVSGDNGLVVCHSQNYETREKCEEALRIAQKTINSGKLRISGL